MQRSGAIVRAESGAADLPVAIRVMGRFVLEVLPAAMASVIGAFLLAYYLFDHSAVVAAAPPMVETPAPPRPVQLVGAEHALIRDFLAAQEAAPPSRAEAADDADIRVAADARRVAVRAHRPATVMAMKSPRRKPAVIASAAPIGASTATAALSPLVIASAQPAFTATAPAVPASLLSTSLAVPGRVVAMTLHAVMAIGGIPSWIGHRVDPGDPAASLAGTAS